MAIMDTEKPSSGRHCQQTGTQLNGGGVAGRGSSNLTGFDYPGCSVRSGRVVAVGQDSGGHCQQPGTKSDVGEVGGRRSHNPSGLDYRGRSVMNRPVMNAPRHFGLRRLADRSSVDRPCVPNAKIIRAEQGAYGNPPSADQPPHNLNPNTRLP